MAIVRDQAELESARRGAEQGKDQRTASLVSVGVLVLIGAVTFIALVSSGYVPPDCPPPGFCQ